MEQREMLTAMSPPLELFTPEAAKLQKHFEGPNQGNLFEKVEYPESGGAYVHYYDHPYPAKGQPIPQAVESISTPKKLLMGTINFFKKHFILAGILLISLRIPIVNIITRRYVKSLLDFYMRDFAHLVIKPYLFEEKNYCKSVREVRKAGLLAIEKVKSRWKEYHLMGLDIVGAIGEWDNAYRYRMQAIVENGEAQIDGTYKMVQTINKEAFRKNPSKEIAKLAILHVHRERGWHEDKGKAIMLGNAVRLLLFFVPEFKKLIIEFVNELNIDEVKLDEADQYYNLNRADYDVYGWPMELRWKKYNEISKDYQAKNQDRITKGREKIEQVTIMTEMRNKIASLEGIPISLFFAIRENGKDRVAVKFCETPFSISNPHLLGLCRDVINAREKKIRK